MGKNKSFFRKPRFIIGDMCHAYDIDFGGMMFFDPIEKAYNIKEEYFLGDITHTDVIGYLPKSEDESPKGIIYRCYETGEPYYAKDVEEDPYYLKAREDMQSSFGVPIIADDHFIGTTVFESKEKDGFPEQTRKAIAKDLKEYRFEFTRLWFFLLSQLHLSYPFLIGSSYEWKQVTNLILQAAKNELPVYIYGERGSGKEAVANLIYHLSSRHPEGEMVSVDCGAIGETISAAELFGSKEGAYTDAVERLGLFGRAEEGMILLDEIAKLPHSIQRKLLRVLDPGEIRPVGADEAVPIDVRLICGTNERLEKAVKESRFLPDLYDRLRMMKIEVPPLKRWKDSIPDLIKIFQDQLEEKNRVEKVPFTRDAIYELQNYDYPGNCRELKRIIADLSIRKHNQEQIEMEDVEEYFKRYEPVFPSQQTQEQEEFTSAQGDSNGSIMGDELNWRDFDQSIHQVERDLVKTGLEETAGNVEQLASIWDVSEKTIYYRCSKHNLNPRDFS